MSLSKENIKIELQGGILNKFKLTTIVSTSNMHPFYSKVIIYKYEMHEQGTFLKLIVILSFGRFQFLSLNVQVK